MLYSIAVTICAIGDWLSLIVHTEVQASVCFSRIIESKWIYSTKKHIGGSDFIALRRFCGRERTFHHATIWHLCVTCIINISPAISSHFALLLPVWKTENSARSAAYKLKVCQEILIYDPRSSFFMYTTNEKNKQLRTNCTSAGPLFDTVCKTKRNQHQ